MSCNKMIDFESPDFDGADVLREDARIDAAEAAAGTQRHLAAARTFETAVLQHAVNSCLNSCLDCLDLLYIPREQQPISDIAIAHDSWKQEAEPEPCSKDSWLRGAIPEAAPVLQHNSSSCSSGQAALLASSSTINSPKGLSSRPMSGLGAAARRSAMALLSVGAEAAAGTIDAITSSLRRTSVSRSSARPTPAIGRSSSVKSSQSVKDGAAAAAAAAASGSSSARRSSIRPAAQQQQQPAAGKQPVLHNDAEDRLRQELQLRRQQEAITREMKQKAEQARAALIAVQKELKGKDYTYDSSGKLVLLQKVDPEHLPAPPGPQFKVHTPAAAPEAEAASKQGSASKSLSSTSRSLAGTHAKGSSSSSSNGVGKLRGSKAPTIPSSDFKQTASQTQPPVLESLRPATGVTLRAGAAAKLGPKQDSAAHPTRAQYQQQAKAQNQQATRVVATAAAGSSAGGRGVAGTVSMRGSSAGVSSAAGAAAGSTSGAPSPAPGVDATGPAATAGGAAASLSGNASPALSSAGDSRSGVSSAGAASLRSTSAGSLSSTGQGLSSNAAQLRTAAAGVQRRPASPDVNLVLVSAADWGTVGSSGYSTPADAPLAVHKPGDKQIKEEFGRTTFLPKIRSPVQTLKPPRSQPASTGSLRAQAAAAAPAAR